MRCVLVYQNSKSLITDICNQSVYYLSFYLMFLTRDFLQAYSVGYFPTIHKISECYEGLGFLMLCMMPWSHAMNSGLHFRNISSTYFPTSANNNG